MGIKEAVEAARNEQMARVGRGLMKKALRAIMDEMTDDELIEPIIKSMVDAKELHTEECSKALHIMLDAINKHEAIVLKNIADNA